MSTPTTGPKLGIFQDLRWWSSHPRSRGLSIDGISIHIDRGLITEEQMESVVRYSIRDSVCLVTSFILQPETSRKSSPRKHCSMMFHRYTVLHQSFERNQYRTITSTFPPRCGVNESTTKIWSPRPGPRSRIPRTDLRRSVRTRKGFCYYTWSRRHPKVRYDDVLQVSLLSQIPLSSA